MAEYYNDSYGPGTGADNSGVECPKCGYSDTKLEAAWKYRCNRCGHRFSR